MAMANKQVFQAVWSYCGDCSYASNHSISHTKRMIKTYLKDRVWWVNLNADWGKSGFNAYFDSLIADAKKPAYSAGFVTSQW